MAAKLLQSLTDENLDLQKQIGCMTGMFQLFDRQHMLAGGRRIVGHTPRRLPAGKSHLSNGTLERDSNNGQLRSASLEKYSNKNIQDRQRAFTESSRASFSSSSRSSSFCSVDYNRATQLEPTSFDGMMFPETPLRDSAISLQDSSTQFSRQTIDLRHLVKDSMYREVQGSSAKARSNEAMDLVAKHRDSPRPQMKTGASIHGLCPEGKSVTPADLKESLRVLAKLQEAPWYHSEPRELLRSASYHSRDGSLVSASKDLPRFSYDGREMNRAPDVSKSSQRLKDLPRLSLDSRQGSGRSLKADLKSNFFVKTMQKDSGEANKNAPNLQQLPGNQARPPSVVAKLMGLETLPDSVSSSDTNVGSSRSYQNEDLGNVSGSFPIIDSRKQIQMLSSSSSKNLWKEPSSPRWRNPDSSMKPLSRLPIEPAPWKHTTDGTKSSQKSVPKSTRSPAKSPNTLPTVYSEIEKRLKDLEFTQSGKDLRALKQILEAMQAKGLLETEKEGQGSNFASHKGHEKICLSSLHDSRSLNNRKSQTDQSFSSTKKKVGLGSNYESPIVIMKPAKYVEKSGIPAASVLSLDGSSCLPPKHQGSESVESRMRPSSGRMSSDSAGKYSERENSVNSVNLKNGRTSKAPHNTTSSQRLSKDNNASMGKNSGSISPRMQQKKAELERRTRPLTNSPDSSKLRKPSNKQQDESVSPVGRRGPKNPNSRPSEGQLGKIHVRPRNSGYHESENLVQSSESTHDSRGGEEFSSERSPSTSNRQVKACGLMVSGSAEKKSALTLNDEEAAELACAPTEYSSPVSVLDNAVHKDNSPSPVKYTGKTLKVDAEGKANTVQESSTMTNCGSNSMESGFTSEINRKKLQNIENLVQKLRRINSSHDEARTDYIASLCENKNSDHRYISEILLASGLLLRDLGSGLANFQFHPSGHPINPDLYLVLEQTKASTLLKEERSSDRTTQTMLVDKFHRKLIFDTVNEIVAQRLSLSEPLSRLLKPTRKAVNAQKLLRDLCSEIEELQAKTSKCGGSDEDDDGWKNILCQDLIYRSENWTNFDDNISGPVLDIERLIFKDLVDEIVMGESTGLKTKSGRHKNHIPK